MTNLLPFLSADIPTSMSNSWCEAKEIPGGTYELGCLFPFVDRRKECQQLIIILHNKMKPGIYDWWIENKTKIGSKELQKKPGIENQPFCSNFFEGFGFIVCGAASGIGKTTFSRAAFWKIERMIKKQLKKGGNDKGMVSFYYLLKRCLEKQLVFRVSYLDDPMEDWERSNPASSIAMRVLWQFSKRRLIEDANCRSYEAFWKKFNFSVSLSQVLDFIGEFLGGDVMVVLNLDETNFLNRIAPEGYLVVIMNHIYKAMTNENVFLVPIFTGTNAAYLANLKETR